MPSWSGKNLTTRCKASEGVPAKDGAGSKEEDGDTLNVMVRLVSLSLNN
jgi:hypothetical protein